MQRTHAIPQAASLLLAGCTLLFGACGGGGSDSGGTGTLNLHVTDAAFEYDIVAEATVSVDKITIFHAADSDDGPIVLYEGAPILLDLFNLRDGLTQPLDPATLPVGSYHQLRLRVTHAHLVLTNGNVYDTDDDTIHLTSQDTSGFKVNFDPAIVIERDQTSNVLLDYDLTHTFHPVPANDALTADHYSLHPVIHVTNMGQVGGISGTVTQDDGLGGLVPVSAATVYVMPPGQTDPTLAVTSTGTSATGTYSVLGLLPGPYDVLAVKADLSALVTGVTVVSGEVAVVDLTIHETTGGVSGLVTQDDGLGGQIPVAGANVYVLPPGITDPLQALATGLTAVDGTYTLTGILAGTYDVRAEMAALSGTAPGIVISVGANTVANVIIQ
jgi:hypothetical protein